MLSVLVGLLDGTSIELNVNENDKIHDVKVLMQRMSGIYYKYQRLIFNGKELNDEMIVRDVGIVNGCKLFCVQKIVEPTIQIFVKGLNGDSVAIDVNPEHTIQDIKSEIAIANEDQQFVFEGKTLQDNTSLNKYGIFNGNTVHLVSCLNGGDDDIGLWPTPKPTDGVPAKGDYLYIDSNESLTSFWDELFTTQNIIIAGVSAVLLISIIIGVICCCVRKYKMRNGVKYAKVNAAATEAVVTERDADTIYDENDARIPLK